MLGRDEAWCRSSGLTRVLPWRKSKHGVRPDLTGVGPLGAESNDEKRWEFKRDLKLTENEKKKVLSEVMRLAVELMFETNVYSLEGMPTSREREGRLD